MANLPLTQKIIFHYPGPLFSETDTGEKKRPKKLLDAFKLLGFEVTVLTGTYLQRLEIFNKIKKNINQFDFIYSENSNLPLAITGKTRFPHFNSIDFQLFKLAKSSKIPCGVFVRDIFWHVKDTANTKGMLKKYLGKILFQQEVKHYFQNCSTIFIPSDGCKKYLNPYPFTNFHLLPPGADVIPFQKNKPKEIIKLVYVGSCKPPVYQVINGFLEMIKSSKIHLTIVTRSNEHEYLKSTLDSTLKNISIQSASDQLLSDLLQKQDIGLACIDSNEYWDLAMPIKIYDYIGHQLPILTLQNGETGKLIKTNQLGWVLKNANEINAFLQNLTPEEISKKSSNVKSYIEKNTWLERAKTISQVLQKK